MKPYVVMETPVQMNAAMQRDASFRGVVYSVFQQAALSQRSGGTVVALVAAHPLAGTTYLANLLHEALNSDGDGSSVVLDCRALAEMHGSTSFNSKNSPMNPAAMLTHTSGGWRGSRDFRANYLSDMRARYASVLVDCPSLKEGTDVLSLAPLVDGVLLVIEANKTTKSQIAFLERTVEGAGGKVLGHILNKRTYPIPDWAYKTLESWGI